MNSSLLPIRGPDMQPTPGFEVFGAFFLTVEVSGPPAWNSLSNKGLGTKDASSGRALELSWSPGYRSRMPLCLTDASNISLVSRLAQKIVIVGLLFSPFRPIIHNLMSNDGLFGLLIRFSHLSISCRILELYFPTVCAAGHRRFDLPIFVVIMFRSTLDRFELGQNGVYLGMLLR